MGFGGVVNDAKDLLLYVAFRRSPWKMPSTPIFSVIRKKGWMVYPNLTHRKDDRKTLAHLSYRAGKKPWRRRVLGHTELQE